MSQLVQVWQTGVLDHWWGAAQDDEDVSGRSRKVVLDHVMAHKSRAVPPIWRKRKSYREKNKGWCHLLKGRKETVLQGEDSLCFHFREWKSNVCCWSLSELRPGKGKFRYLAQGYIGGLKHLSCYQDTPFATERPCSSPPRGPTGRAAGAVSDLNFIIKKEPRCWYSTSM